MEIFWEGLFMRHLSLMRTIKLLLWCWLTSTLGESSDGKTFSKYNTPVTFLAL
ncbi:unnamed protein product [Albugo candida]|uniref:Uncharacterized protein n=1 Tax=Albugo candida TaxID=65357 RepID=A0A024GVM7_9STRA|nr:unnamed protein product [Albugo candida]|eukprot:CCI50868.1 unnamed protein product [Albugo candida]